MNHKGKKAPIHKIGEVRTPPYEFIWDCSYVPDQNLGKLMLYCDVIDNAENVCSKPTQDFMDFTFYLYEKNTPYDSTGNQGKTLKAQGPNVVIDRNLKKNDNYIRSSYTKNGIVIDGDLREWAPKDSIEFKNNDNIIKLYSAWNYTYVIFGIRVEDTSIISSWKKAENDSSTAYLEEVLNRDEIELFIDPDHDRFEILSIPDRHFFFSPTGVSFEHFRKLEKNYRMETNTSPNIKYKTHINGTVNEANDNDHYYIIEMAISWKELDIEPENNRTIGFEVWNNDLDFENGNWFYAGWTTTAPNRHNPSEWGYIIFTGGNNYLMKAIVMAFLGFIGSVMIFIAVKKYRSHNKRVESPDVENEHIAKAKEYINKHYSDETISRDEVARQIGLNPPYFGVLFKNETNFSFTNYILRMRIEKSKSLLTATRKTIAEIAYEVGFSSQSYFDYCFKKLTNISPVKYRKRQKR